jgi:hypothetical protein
MTQTLHRTAVAAVLILLSLGSVAQERALALPRSEDGPGLSLRIADEAAPAGSIVQIKVEVTEPKPISTGRGKIKPRGFASINGIVLMNEGQDTFGVAMVDGTDLSFAITSPTGVFGTPADYPILGIAGTVANASRGTSFPLTLEGGGLEFRDPSGAVYPYEIDNGQLTVADDVVTIGNVSPGSAVVPAGGVVHVTGTNFRPDTRIRLGEATIVEQRFISSQRIDVVVGQATRMHGMRVRARNDKDGNGGERSESEYFSYERTAPIGASSDPMLSKTVPLFAPATWTTATVDLQQRRASGRRRSVRPATGAAAARGTYGFALQNLEKSSASVTIELLDFSGNPYAVNTVDVAPNRYLVRELGEVFGIVSRPAALRVRSTVPIQVLGLTADATAGTATALPPR